MLLFTWRISASNHLLIITRLICDSGLNIWHNAELSLPVMAITLYLKWSGRTVWMVVWQLQPVMWQLQQYLFFFSFLNPISLFVAVFRIYFMFILRKAIVSFWWHCAENGQKYALTAITFIHFDCCTVNIQKADMCSELGPLGPWQVINQWNHNREARLGCVWVCEYLCVNVKWGRGVGGGEEGSSSLRGRLQ